MRSLSFSSLAFYLCWPVFWVLAPLQRRVRVVVRNEKKEILLVKNRLAPNVWQLPGGGIKQMESVGDAARREIQEELQLSLDQVRILNETARVTSMFGLLLRLHFCTATVSSKQPIVAQKREIRDYAWFAADQLPRGIAADVDVGLRLGA